MRLFFGREKGDLASRLNLVDAKIARVRREIRNLDRFVANPKPRRRREDVTVARLLGPAALPESQKRLVSYLSTGSFQTIGLRKHELKAARIKAALVVLAAIIAFFYLVYVFIVPLFH